MATPVRLTVIIPAYNEARTIAKVLKRVAAVDLEMEIIVVDDSSTDTTAEEIGSAGIPSVRMISHEQNLGKGAAVRSGLAQATGDVVVIQDGDLEYDPQDFVRLMKPILSGQTRVVFGYRQLATQSLLYRNGNRFLTLLTNVLFGASVRDMETCYKMWRREVLCHTTLKAESFDIEVELTVRFLHHGENIVQIPITYAARTDKKLRWWIDGPRAVISLLRFRFLP